MGNLAEAAALLQESLTLKRQIHDGRGVVIALIGLADVAMAAGDGQSARTYLAEALVLAQQVGEVKLMLEGLAVWGTLRCQESADPLPGARLLAFVVAHPALPQEVRDQVEKTCATLQPALWARAAAWASAQTLPALITAAVTELASSAQ